MRVRAMMKRIVRQLRGDKRTLGLMIFAPLILLTLIYLILNTSAYEPNVGVSNAPVAFTDALYENNVSFVRCSETEADALLEDGEIIAAVAMENNKLTIRIDGTNKSNAKQTIQALEAARAYYLSALSGGAGKTRTDLTSDIRYVYGAEDMEMFDNFGAAMIGILIFFFVFLISGIAFLQERTSGTLERLLSTPIRRSEIVAGYVLGFGTVTVIQSVLVTVYAVYVLKVMMIGSIWLVLLLSLLSAMAALTMGLLASTAANSEFQVVQFIPLVLVPQIFFSGLFTLDGVWQYIGYAMPIYYVADGLTKVMIKGMGFSDILRDLAVLAGFCLVFMALNTRMLRRHRRI